MNIYVKTKFDTKVIETAVEKACRTALRRSGAYIRKAAAGSIRRTKAKPSAPGTPPHTRQGQLKRAILFGTDAANQSVVIGPAAHLFSDVGRYHEFGGTQTKRPQPHRYQVGDYGPIALNAAGKPVNVRLHTVAMVQRANRIEAGRQPVIRKYPPRPFMGPALSRSLPRITRFWQNVVK